MASTLRATLAFDPAVTYNGQSNIGTLSSPLKTFGSASDLNDFLVIYQQLLNVWAVDVNGKSFGDPTYIPTLPAASAIVLAWWNSLITGTIANIQSAKRSAAIATAANGVSSITLA